jgi:hypothetical protein
LGIEETHVLAIDLLALLCCRIGAQNVEMPVLHEIVIGIAAALLSPAGKARIAARHQSTALIIRWGLDLFDALFKIQSRLGWRPMNT